ncbi:MULTISPECIES: hypothetical protein [unclassified Streptomyces]|uniref:hypothetical protein n=1 Tax=unclassified Streptomyces TaxID=2593676 RepID=UPI0033AC8285
MVIRRWCHVSLPAGADSLSSTFVAIQEVLGWTRLGERGTVRAAPRLLGPLAGRSVDGLGIAAEGDPGLFVRLLSYRTRPDPGFPVVTP